MFVSCSGENYNEGFSVKTPARATASGEASGTGDVVSDSTESGTTSAPTATPTMNKDEFGQEVVFPTFPIDTELESATATPGTSAAATETPSNGTAQPTQTPVIVTPAEKTGIQLPPVWFK